MRKTDLISREELFEELNCINLPVGNETVDKLFSVIENMPSAQPEREYTMEEFMFGQDMGNPEDGSL